MVDVFVSYKAEDRARVKPLVDALTAEGLTVWWDLHIEAGSAWRQTIERELEAAACVVVVWSDQSAGERGHFVQDEASRAQKRGVLLPVAIDAVRAPLGFGQQHVMSLIGWRGGRRDARFRDVLAAVKAIIAGGPKPVPTARAQKLARTAAGSRRTVLAAGGAGLAVLAGALWFKAPARLCKAAGLDCPGLGAPAVVANSLAVLPFTNLSGDPAQDYFSDGLSEELISTLARVKPLQVAARTSSFKFKNSKETSAAIGAALGVAYILDGSVRRDGQMVRVSAQLADAKTGFERWSQTFDREMKDIFAVQSGIAQAVAEALKVQLLGADVANLNRGDTLSPEAYDDFLRGRSLLEAGGSEAAYRAALARLDAAIVADPRYAAAHAERAVALVSIADQFDTPDHAATTYEEALKAARRGVELAPDLAQAQRILATTLIYAKHDFAGAKQAFDQAKAAHSGDAALLTDYGVFTSQLGDFLLGLAALQRATTLDPLNPSAFRTLGLMLIGARRYPEAVAAFQHALALSPKMLSAHSLIGQALMLQGKLGEAKAEYALEPLAWARLVGQAVLFRRIGDTAGAKAALNALIADGGDGNAYQVAEVHAQWGEADTALAALDTAIKLNDSGLLMLKVDPLFDPLRPDPRFAARLSRVGFS